MNNEEKFGVGCLAILFIIIGLSLLLSGIHGCKTGTEVTIPNRMGSTSSPYKMHFGFAFVSGAVLVSVGLFAFYRMHKERDKW